MDRRRSSSASNGSLYNNVNVNNNNNNESTIEGKRKNSLSILTSQQQQASKLDQSSPNSSRSSNAAASPRSQLALSLLHQPKILKGQAMEMQKQLSELAFTHASSLITCMQLLEEIQRGGKLSSLVVETGKEEVGGDVAAGNGGNNASSSLLINANASKGGLEAMANLHLTSTLGLQGHVEGLERRVLKVRSELEQKWVKKAAVWLQDLSPPSISNNNSNSNSSVEKESGIGGWLEDVIKAPWYLNVLLDQYLKDQNKDSSNTSNNNSNQQQDLILLMDTFVWCENLMTNCFSSSSAMTTRLVIDLNSIDSDNSSSSIASIVRDVVFKEVVKLFREKFIPLVINRILKSNIGGGSSSSSNSNSSVVLNLPLAMKIVSFLRKVPLLLDSLYKHNSNSLLLLPESNNGDEDESLTSTLTLSENRNYLVQIYFLQQRLSILRERIFVRQFQVAHEEEAGDDEEGQIELELKHGIQATRQVLFDVITQYSALFASSSNNNTSNSNSKNISETNETILSHFIHKLALRPLYQWLSHHLSQLSQVSAIVSVLVLCQYLSNSLARVGYEFCVAGALSAPLSISGVHDADNDCNEVIGSFGLAVGGGPLNFILESNVKRILEALRASGWSMIEERLAANAAVVATSSQSSEGGNDKNPWIDEKIRIVIESSSSNNNSAANITGLSPSSATSPNSNSFSSVTICSPPQSLLPCPIYALYANTVVSMLNQVRHAPSLLCSNSFVYGYLEGQIIKPDLIKLKGLLEKSYPIPSKATEKKVVVASEKKEGSGENKNESQLNGTQSNESESSQKEEEQINVDSSKQTTDHWWSPSRQLEFLEERRDRVLSPFISSALKSILL